VRSQPAALVLAGTLAFTTVPDRASAQEQPRFAADVAFGWVGFADDGVVSETLVGGVARWYLTPRISIGPEVVFLDGRNHSHLIATGNVVWDLFSPETARRHRLTPFLVGGGGVFQTREFFPTGTFTSSDGAFTAGGGIRGLLGDRFTVGFDARVGWELHLRINGTVGVQWGR
jgi:hypothetical protein